MRMTLVHGQCLIDDSDTAHCVAEVPVSGCDSR